MMRLQLTQLFPKTITEVFQPKYAFQFEPEHIANTLITHTIDSQ